MGTIREYTFCEKVLNSCKTLDQVTTAIKFIQLAWEKNYLDDEEYHLLLSQRESLLLNNTPSGGAHV